MNVVAHNLLAMNAQQQLGINSKNKAKSTEKLSSGYKINRAADDAAGLAISEKMRRQIRGLSQGADNTQDGISFIQIGDGALDEVQDMLNRINQLSVKAANGTLSKSDRKAVDDEVQQLKTQINQVGNNTKFNELRVFSDEHASISVDGDPGDINFFDASYDPVTRKVEYGGLFVMGERISWDTMDPNMVYIDPDTNEQKFHEGTYSFSALNGMQFTLECKEGDKTPIMSRKIELSADERGIAFDNYRLDWSELKDEFGRSASATNAHDGVWSIDYFGAKININIFNGSSSLGGMAAAINGLHTQKASYSLESGYLKDIPEKAVTTSFGLGVQIKTYELATKLKDSENPYAILRARCDESGIWLQNYDRVNLEYVDIDGSLNTWEDMGITDWDDGTEIGRGKKHTYSYDSADCNIEFDYFMSDYTSVDSVIMGLDTMPLGTGGITVDNHFTASTTNPNIEILTMTSRANLTFLGEYESDRDFTQKNATIKENNLHATAESINEISLSYNSNKILVGSTSKTESEMAKDIEEYYSKIAHIKEAKFLAGEPTDDITPPDLKDVLGADKIDTDGYFSSTLTIDSSIKHTNGMLEQRVMDGQTYPAAYMDFSQLGTDYRYADLAGAGFDSTCMTCNNHYSIRFIYGALDGEQYTKDGYGYSKETLGHNYLLNIDLTTLKTADNKEFDADKFTKSIVNIIEEAHQDFHYTQYAAKGGVLYAFDNRERYVGSTQGEFYTKPYEQDSLGNYFVELDGNSPYAEGLEILGYWYNYKDAADNVKVSAVEATDGQYVEIVNPGGQKTYFEKTPENMYDEFGNPVKLYNIEVNYEYRGVTGKTASAKEYAADKVNEMLKSTSIKAETDDYAKMNLSGHEWANVCYLGDFGALVKNDYDFDGVRIQHSSEINDFTEVPRFAINTSVLDLFSANTRTVEDALNCIDQVSNAQSYVAQHRSLWGAYQNRLEHTLKENNNTMENTQSAESLIRDADMAEEMMRFSKQNILEQAGQSMLAQANQLNQSVLSIIG